MWVIILTVVFIAGAPIVRYQVLPPKKKKFWHEIQLIDELVVGSVEPPDALAACDRICTHFAYEPQHFLIQPHTVLKNARRARLKKYTYFYLLKLQLGKLGKVEWAYLSLQVEAPTWKTWKGLD